MAPNTGRGAPLNRHSYLLATDADYRVNFANAVLLRMATLVEVLALRTGLSINPDTGEIDGITDEEREKLMIPAVNRDEVREARPVRQPQSEISQEVKPLDPYAAQPDPGAQFGSEEIKDQPVDDSYLVQHAGSEPLYEASLDTPSSVGSGEPNPPDDGSGDSDEDSEEDDGPNKEDLKEELRDLGLPVSGTKAELQARLEEAKSAEESKGTGESEEDEENKD